MPLFVSRRVLAGRKSLPVAASPWVLDSGGFTELNLYGGWRTPLKQYVAEVRRYQAEIGNLDWVAPMDWMCEPSVLEKTWLSVNDHQICTLKNFLRLRSELGPIVAPVLQGWKLGEYARHVEMYEKCGVALYREPIVGLGSICRRGQDAEIQTIVRTLKTATPTIQLHAFGVRTRALDGLSDVLTSSDSMAWSMRGRHDRLPGCTHKSCANCRRYAHRWYYETVTRLGQGRLEVA